jgi:hypothetical protein
MLPQTCRGAGLRGGVLAKGRAESSRLTKLPEGHRSDPSEYRHRRRSSGGRHGGGGSRHALYGSLQRTLRRGRFARQRAQPVALFGTAVPIPPGAFNDINRYYVLCTRDRAIPAALQRRMIAENMCADVVELDTDHTPHLSMTNELANALDRFATHGINNPR